MDAKKYLMALQRVNLIWKQVARDGTPDTGAVSSIHHPRRPRASPLCSSSVSEGVFDDDSEAEVSDFLPDVGSLLVGEVGAVKLSLEGGDVGYDLFSGALGVSHKGSFSGRPNIARRWT